MDINLTGLVQELELIAMGKEVLNKDYGICMQITDAVGRYEGRLFRRICTTHPEFSGQEDYPLPGGHMRYRKDQHYGTMWHGSSGNERRALAQWVADVLKDAPQDVLDEFIADL